MLVIGDLSRLNAQRHPGKPALVMGGDALSYAALNRRSNQLTHALLGLGVTAGDRVALLAYNSIDYAVVLQAVAKCGAVAVPLNFRATATDVRHALTDAEPKVLFIETPFDACVAEALQGLAQPPLCVHLEPHGSAPTLDTLAVQAPATDPGLEVDPNSACVLLYTSGTTGRPKGVLMSHAVIFRMFLATAVEARLVHEDVYLLAVPMFHSAGMNMALNQCLFLGGTGIVHRGPFEPDTILALIARHRITLSVLVPTTVGVLAFHPRLADYDVSCLHKIFYGSMPIAPQVLAQARKAFPSVRFTQIYGSTECGNVAFLRHEDHEEHSQCTGSEALLTAMRIVDEQDRDVPAGGVGEIIVDRQRMGMIGYWKNEAATQETVRNGWIRSGDLARNEGGGFFTIVDRLKDVIISGGENIYPKEIELALAEHPAVREVAVFGIPDTHYGETVCAAVALHPGHSASTEELDAWCAERLARYKRPRRFEFHERLPRNASDKILKPTLRAPHWQK